MVQFVVRSGPWIRSARPLLASTLAFICAQALNAPSPVVAQAPANVTASTIEGGDAWGFDDSEAGGKARHCRHGVWNPQTKLCDCFPGWSTAHITDTVDFFEGVCEQYHCKSDDICAKVLNIEGATCPVKGWNCYCGWKYGFMMEGHGWETPEKEGGGECMGVMYTFSVWATMNLEIFFSQAWMVFLLVAVVLLPFGRKRFNCDHHRPSLPRFFRNCTGCPSTCNGECVAITGVFETFRDDIAWSLYIMEVGVWSYIFLAVVYVIALFIWSVILWTMIIIVCICLLIAGLCAACGEGAGACSCDCCCAGGASGGGPLDCCMVPIGGHVGGAGGGSADMFYWSGTYPYDPFWGYSGYGGHSSPSDCDCCGGCCVTLCRPVAWLVWVFPAMPENLWGGIVGWMMGTRTSTSTERLYQGGSCIVDFMGMSWRRTRDLHDNNGWRQQVHDFLVSEGDHAAQPARVAGGYDRLAASQSGLQDEGWTIASGVRRSVKTLGRARLVLVDRPFSIAEDSCIPSSFEDYEKNECWICTGSCEEWDMWMSCHHLFCKGCSSEMLRRNMPCPLCRVASTTVLRGTEARGPPGAGVQMTQS